MNRLIVPLLAILALFAIFFTRVSHAQTVVKIPFVTAKFQWTNGVTDSTHSAATAHIVTCGTLSVSVQMPTNSVLLSTVVPSPGVYSCNLYAKNDFGRQTEANVPFPQFEAGLPPGPPTNLQVVTP